MIEDEDSSGVLVRISGSGLPDDYLPLPEMRSSLSDSEPEEEEKPPEPLEESEGQFSAFYNNPELSDMVLEILPSGQKFYGHKMILSMTSGFFKTMFYSEHWKSPLKECVRA